MGNLSGGPALGDNESRVVVDDHPRGDRNTAADHDLQSQTTNHYSAGGRGGNTNTFTVDGLDVDSDIGEGITNLTPNVDSLAEVTIQTNTYDVDYGKSSSIRILMSSRPGTAGHHGFASGYYAYQGLVARGEYGVPRPTRLSPFHTTNLFFGVGGPILPNKIFLATLELY